MLKISLARLRRDLTALARFGSNPGGGVSRKAVAYSSPLKAGEAGKLTVRAHRGNAWSAPVSGREK